MRNDFQSDYLMHHGILGQKWGVRRYQNDDGSLTDAGKRRYGSEDTKSISSAKGIQKRLNDVDTAIARNKRKVNDELSNMHKYTDKADKLERKLNKKNPMYGRVNIENEKLRELRSKADSSFNKAREAQHMIDEGNKQINSLINESQKSGYLMSSKEVMRDVSDGREVAKSLLMTAGASMLMGPFGAAAVMTTHKQVRGTQYKVKERKQ